MIKPASYWALHKVADPATLGRVGVSLAGREVDPPLSPAEQALVGVIQKDSEWYDERVEELRTKAAERKAAYRKRKIDEAANVPNVPECPRDKTGQASSDACPAPIRPSVRPSVPPVPKGTNNNRSRSRSAGAPAREGTPNGNGNGNGGDFPKKAEEDMKLFADELEKDPDGGVNVFFDQRHHPATICMAMTGDRASRARWMQFAKAIPDDAMREELFSMYREIRAGECPKNRGAALNARLAKLMK